MKQYAQMLPGADERPELQLQHVTPEVHHQPATTEGRLYALRGALLDQVFGSGHAGRKSDITLH
jgi:hypothetical protein